MLCSVSTVFGIVLSTADLVCTAQYSAQYTDFGRYTARYRAEYKSQYIQNGTGSKFFPCSVLCTTSYSVRYTGRNLYTGQYREHFILLAILYSIPKTIPTVQIFFTWDGHAHRGRLTEPALYQQILGSFIISFLFLGLLFQQCLSFH